MVLNKIAGSGTIVHTRILLDTNSGRRFKVIWFDINVLLKGGDETSGQAVLEDHRER